MVYVEEIQEIRNHKKAFSCMLLGSPQIPEHGTYGPILSEIHLVLANASASILAHEVIHAISELPRNAGRPHDNGKMGEVAAYRVQRIMETIGTEFLALGMNFLPSVPNEKPLRIAVAEKQMKPSKKQKKEKD